MNWEKTDLDPTGAIAVTSRKTPSNSCARSLLARLIVDTGFLVALYIRRDVLHESAIEFLRREAGTLITVPAVVVETCYFLDAPG